MLFDQGLPAWFAATLVVFLDRQALKWFLAIVISQIP
jgi:hypothetical protein